MSSFRLKFYFKGSFQHSVSILTNILQSFLQHLVRIRMMPNSAKHKQTKTTQQKIHCHLKKVDVCRFSVKALSGLFNGVTFGTIADALFLTKRRATNCYMHFSYSVWCYVLKNDSRSAHKQRRNGKNRKTSYILTRSKK